VSSLQCKQQHPVKNPTDARAIINRRSKWNSRELLKDEAVLILKLMGIIEMDCNAKVLSFLFSPSGKKPSSIY
jgi:hypothetical protein